MGARRLPSPNLNHQQKNHPGTQPISAKTKNLSSQPTTDLTIKKIVIPTEAGAKRRRSGEPALSEAEGNLLFPLQPPNP
jgi:hypothetical protein